MPKITVLAENSASRDDVTAEYGLSLYVEHGDSVILFDTGQSDAFLRNAQRLGCDLDRVTDIVLSHGHYDHSTGLQHALTWFMARRPDNPPRLITHPDSLADRFWTSAKGKVMSIGMPEASKKALEGYPLTLTREPLWLREGIVFLGEIPRAYPEMTALLGELGHPNSGERDEILDDSGLACVTGRGLVLILGCGHAGMVNIMEYARAVTGVEHVHTVFGGLHLAHAPGNMVEKTLEYALAQKVERLYGCHCTGDAINGSPLQNVVGTGDTVMLNL